MMKKIRKLKRGKTCRKQVGEGDEEYDAGRKEK
jgi:hypothetical protein